MEFNEEQKQAISSNNHSLIISAAAGSGKTTVLIEKIIHQLTVEHKDISSMLIITFTREAASHMRNKLKEKLEQKVQEEADDNLINALAHIESAQISTIHSFCSTLLRENFEALSIDPMFRISEEHETDPLFDAAFQTSIDEMLGEEDDKQISEENGTLHAILKILSMNVLQSMIDMAYHKLMGLPDAFALAEKACEDISSNEEHNPWREEILGGIQLDLLAIPEYLNSGEKLVQESCVIEKCVQIFEQDTKILLPLLQKDMHVSMRDQLTNIQQNWTKMIKPRKCTEEESAWYDRFKQARDRIMAGKKGILTESIEKLIELENEEHIQANETIALQAKTILKLTQKAHAHFLEMKREINILDFEDLEQLTYQLLTDGDLHVYQAEIRHHYTDIYVDECQDISAIQNAIIQGLHAEENQLTMVGDVKQSIYRFRHADPSLFLYYRDHFADDPEALQRRIFFQSNYRSSMTIVGGVNEVFRRSFRREINELDYAAQDELVFGKVNQAEEKIDVDLIRKNPDIPMLEAQCIHVAEKIRSFLGRSYTDRKGNIKTYEYRDMAILLRSAKDNGPEAVEYFKQLHIPVYYDGGENYYGLPEILSVISVLQTIDNYRQDIPLLATLKSVAFHFSDEELASVRIGKKENVPFYEAFDFCATQENALGKKCKRVRETLEEWRFLAQNTNLPEFVWLLLRITGIYAYCGSFRDGDIRQANLRLLCKKAQDYDAHSNGSFADFVAAIGEGDQQQRQKESDSISYLSSNDDVVRLMTMHKSKGLEYPIVFILGMETKLNKPISSTMLQIDLAAEESGRRSLGFYMPKMNAQQLTYMHNYGKEAFAIRAKKNELAEQSRLLYVAMTRAMDKLILVGEYQEKSENLWRAQNAGYRIWNSKTMIDLVMPAVVSDTEEKFFALTICDAQAVEEKETEEVQSILFDSIYDAIEQEQMEFQVFADDDWKMQPLKTTVTSMAIAPSNATLADEIITEEDIDLKRSSIDIVPMLLSPEPGKPLFLSENLHYGAERGSLTHRFLSLIDLSSIHFHDSIATWIRKEMNRMVRDGLFLQKDLKVIDAESIADFFSSDLGIRMTMAEEIRREWQFMVPVEEEGSTVMQGIVDTAFFENGEWVILDYKTEYIQDEENFVRKHTAQLNLYRESIEKMTKMPVSEMWLYSLHRNKAYRVEKRSYLM